MSFWLSKVLWVFVQPSNLLLVLALAGAVLLWTPWRRTGRGLVSFALLLLGAGAFLPLGEALYRPLEDRFAATLGDEGPIEGIIVLGGAENEGLSVLYDRVNLSEAAERLTEFATLARRHPGARLLYAGGSGSLTPGQVREADIARRLLDEIGAPVERVLFEGASRNTYENAQRLVALVQPAPAERWLLVTSAFHMPRAVGCFRKAGWNVEAYPVDHRLGRPQGLRVLGDAAAGLRLVDDALHEWVGLAAYRLMGRTTAFLPGPTSQSRE